MCVIKRLWAVGAEAEHRITGGREHDGSPRKTDGVAGARKGEMNAAVRGCGDSGARTADEFLNDGVGCEATAAAASVPEGAWDDARLVLCRCVGEVCCADRACPLEVSRKAHRVATIRRLRVVARQFLVSAEVSGACVVRTGIGWYACGLHLHLLQWRSRL